MLSLLIFLPVILFFLAALGIVILQQSRPSIGYSWLIAALTGLSITILMIFFRWRLPMRFAAEQWRPFGEISSPLAFLLDLSSWPYAFCLAALAFAFILTDAARLETEAWPYNWAIGLGLTGIGILAVMAGNPMTLVLVWTAVDFIELLIVMSTDAGRRMGQQTVTIFSVRSGGSLLVIIAMLFARSWNVPFDLDSIPNELAIFMLLAVGLRLGVLPLNLPYTREVYNRRGLGNLMRMIGPASSLAVLGHMPEQAIPIEWHSVFLAFSALAALYGSAMWVSTDHELNGRPYWSIAFAALAITCVIKGNPRASIAWGVALLLVGSVIFFYSAHRRRNLFIPILAAVGITGLPYSPAASGWVGIVGDQFSFSTFIFLIAVVLLIWGFIRQSLRPREEIHRMERWVHPVYPAGLLSLIIAQWIIGMIGWPGSFQLGVWWISMAVLVLAGAGIALAFLLVKRSSTRLVSPNWLGFITRRTGLALGTFFRLNWLYQFLLWLYHRIQGIVQLITAIFEGDGGILWSMVLLAIFISLVWLGGGP